MSKITKTRTKYNKTSKRNKTNKRNKTKYTRGGKSDKRTDDQLTRQRQERIEERLRQERLRQERIQEELLSEQILNEGLDEGEAENVFNNERENAIRRRIELLLTLILKQRYYKYYCKIMYLVNNLIKEKIKI